MSVIRRLYENGTITISPLHRSHGKPPGGKGKKKTFKLSPGRKRLIESSAIRMFYKKKYTLKFGTLTFSAKVDHKAANKCLSKFIDNLKKTYHANSYIFVKEIHKNGNPHYHFIIDLPYINYMLLNNGWCSACSDIMPYSPNAFTTSNKKNGKRGSVVTNISDVVKYITKYITKANENVIRETRNYFIDHNTLSTGKIIDYNEYIYLITKFQSKTIVKDHFTLVYLKNFHFLPEKILPGFKKDVKKPKKIPDSFTPNFDFFTNIPAIINTFYDSRL